MFISDHKQRVFFQGRDASFVRLKSLVNTIKAFDKGHSLDKVTPQDAAGWTYYRADIEALIFYVCNHIFGALELYNDGQKLDKYQRHFVDYFFDCVNFYARRSFYYVVKICTRESRHVKLSDSFCNSVKKEFGDNYLAWINTIHHSGSEGAIEKFFSGKSPLQDETLGRYFEFMVYVFYKGKFAGGYGGPKWGAVAQAGYEFVRGKYSAEIFMDTVYTLCHNGGPIFNKGMYYEANYPLLNTVLDVQRTGQTPQFLGFLLGLENTGLISKTSNSYSVFVDGDGIKLAPSLKVTYDYCSGVNRDLLNTPIDFVLVDNESITGTDYKGYIELANKLYGNSQTNNLKKKDGVDGHKKIKDADAGTPEKISTGKYISIAGKQYEVTGRKIKKH